MAADAMIFDTFYSSFHYLWFVSRDSTLGI